MMTTTMRKDEIHTVELLLKAIPEADGFIKVNDVWSFRIHGVEFRLDAELLSIKPDADEAEVFGPKAARMLTCARAMVNQAIDKELGRSSPNFPTPSPEPGQLPSGRSASPALPQGDGLPFPAADEPQSRDGAKAPDGNVIRAMRAVVVAWVGGVLAGAILAVTLPTSVFIGGLVLSFAIVTVATLIASPPSTRCIAAMRRWASRTRRAVRWTRIHHRGAETRRET